MFALLIVGSVAPLAIIPVARADGWPSATAWVLAGFAVFMAGYALALLPTRLVISDDGVTQKLLLSESRLRWEELVEWRYCIEGPEFEKGEMKAQTKNRWHSIEFWVKDKTGRKHHFKRWLVYGQRSKQVADILRERGIDGG